MSRGEIRRCNVGIDCGRGKELSCSGEIDGGGGGDGGGRFERDRGALGDVPRYRQTDSNQ